MPDGVAVSGPTTLISHRDLTGTGWAVGALAGGLLRGVVPDQWNPPLPVSLLLVVLVAPAQLDRNHPAEAGEEARRRAEQAADSDEERAAIKSKSSSPRVRAEGRRLRDEAKRAKDE